jgi:hypothetical protein
MVSELLDLVCPCDRAPLITTSPQQMIRVQYLRLCRKNRVPACTMYDLKAGILCVPLFSADVRVLFCHPLSPCLCILRSFANDCSNYPIGNLTAPLIQGDTYFLQVKHLFLVEKILMEPKQKRSVYIRFRQG